MLKKFTKIKFLLTQDDDGYPPADNEFVWSTKVGKNSYRIENIPFYIRGVSYGDVISVRKNGNHFEYDELISESGHSTIRIVFYDLSVSDDVKSELEKIGCSCENSHLKNMIAVDIPPKVNFFEVINCITNFEGMGKLGYEEACIAHELTHV